MAFWQSLELHVLLTFFIHTEDESPMGCDNFKFILPVNSYCCYSREQYYSLRENFL